MMDLFNLLNRTLTDQMGFDSDSKGPSDLTKQLTKTAHYLDFEDVDSSISKVLKEIISDDPDGDIRNLFGHFITSLDSCISPVWSTTPPNSEERRNEIMTKLGIIDNLAIIVNEQNPYFDRSNLPVIITEEYREWYTEERKRNRFYWDNYSKYLIESGWPKTSVLKLDEATDEVISRLDDPQRNDGERKSSRGLVVGYVQSGKTANFTGVVAKSIDSGYKMIIILAGILNVLRKQTQRRLDKELVGKNNLLYALQSLDVPEDYAEDNDWLDFVEYDPEPRTRIERLTDSEHDFSSDFAQKLVPMLAYQDRELRDSENMKNMPVKILVVKKHSGVLGKLIKDLNNVRSQIKDLPVILIDDESDQASINTGKITKSESEKRTRVNDKIVKLLEVFTAPQYIGYTATPAANVLINPDDNRDIFPKDFILTLPRPIGYMGVRDFYDFDEDWNDIPANYLENNWNDLSKDDAEEMQNGRAYVRPVIDEDEKPENLEKAIRSYILAGAIKLYRNAHGINLSTKHHTMIMHSNVRNAVQNENSAKIKRIYKKLTKSESILFTSLNSLYNKDYLPVSKKKSGLAPEFSTPEFSMLTPYINQAIKKISRLPVRVVNGEPEHEDNLPNFEKEQVWSILVGGAKLSRGYTVEGLTVSYYRRKTGAGDTLMQAGRWFGFRKNYSDLVRLYIGVAEPAGRASKNLYAEFKDICRDEELFREELRTYRLKEDGSPIRPKDVLPSLPIHGLSPTAANKMQYADLHLKNLGSRYLSKAANVSRKPKDNKKNLKLFRELISKSNVLEDSEFVVQATSDKKVSMKMFRVGKEDMLDFLRGYTWLKTHVLFEEIEFSSNEKINSNVDDWLIAMPQLKQHKYTLDLNNGSETGIYFRKTDEATGKYKAFSVNEDVEVCKSLLDLPVKREVDSLTGVSKSVRSAILLIYPTLPDELKDKQINKIEESVSLGFGIHFPKNNDPIDKYVMVKAPKWG